MSNDEEYNGWNNYDTWLFALNIDNSEGTYNEKVELMRAGSSPEELKNWAEMFWNDEQGVYRISDVWTQRDWDNIDWREIYENWAEDYPEDTEEDTEEDEEEDEDE